MLINCDIKGLEVVVAAELSQDKILCQEIIDKEDTHGKNQQTLGLPSRLIAKIFIFRLLFGGSAYSYANDPDFSEVGFNQKQWQQVIDAFYLKYNGLQRWHDSLLDTVKKNGFLEIPSGRCYTYEAKFNGREWKWPLTTIKNYSVQGFGADLVMLARIEFCKQLRESGLEGKFIQTIHDSLVVDTPSKNVNQIAKMLQNAIAKVPELCYTNWQYKFSLPLTSEVQVGMNKRNLEDYKTT
jgi:DNA polymerase I